MIVQVIAAIRVYDGKPYDLPLVAGWVRKRHPGRSPGEPVVF